APGMPSITFSGGQLQSTTADYYQWYLGGVLISGATSQNYTPTASGDYQVEVTNMAGCSTMSGIYTLTSVSLEEELLLFNLYPTPAREGFYLESEHLTESNLELTDFTGRIIRSMERIGANKIYINTSEVAAGSYLIKITDSKNRIGIRQVIIR
ncbi:MAG: T9SS type A sorting domain-containing protein, partial [Crocinitomicaceae bacterium]|nr:T9SS type A sorting domain-containing protein [Crocinitomicaceae bacterium]